MWVALTATLSTHTHTHTLRRRIKKTWETLIKWRDSINLTKKSVFCCCSCFFMQSVDDDSEIVCLLLNLFWSHTSCKGYHPILFIWKQCYSLSLSFWGWLDITPDEYIDRTVTNYFSDYMDVHTTNHSLVSVRIRHWRKRNENEFIAIFYVEMPDSFRNN